ncbi:MAG TPA: hypothetical protein VLT82_16795 [Myxococcaceae bacterium]|nr:hypothetical protein [Myxococcaceae bacterium]
MSTRLSARPGFLEDLPRAPCTGGESLDRLALLATLALASSALAQEAGGYSAGPGLGSPDYQTTVSAPRVKSPVQTQDRVFAATRFWKLDPGRYEVEVWWDEKFKRDEPNESVLKLEIEIGLTPHLQLDLYQNFVIQNGQFDVEGNQIELRYAFAAVYNEIPWNPVLYLEWHPRKQAQDRAEVRLLMGGDLPAAGLWSANVFAEGNVDYFNASYAEGFDGEFGITAAVSFPVLADVLRLGAEVQGGVDQHGSPRFYASGLVGPNILLTYRPAGLKLTATALFGLFHEDPACRLFVIAGWQF